jgi:hypothetical protein
VEGAEEVHLLDGLARHRHDRPAPDLECDLPAAGIESDRTVSASQSANLVGPAADG